MDKTSFITTRIKIDVQVNITVYDSIADDSSTSRQSRLSPSPDISLFFKARLNATMDMSANSGGSELFWSSARKVNCLLPAAEPRMFGRLSKPSLGVLRTRFDRSRLVWN